MLEDPLRTPPEQRQMTSPAGSGAARAAPPTARSGLPSLDHRAEQLRLGAQTLLGEPVLTVLVGRGVPPRKWPSLVALVVALMGAASMPLGGPAPWVFWGGALVSAFLWRQHQEGRFPRRRERPAGALAITPTRLALLSVRRGWFQAALTPAEVLVTEPLRELRLHNRVGWGRLELGGRPLYIDEARRKGIITAVNGLIEDVAHGGWHAVPFAADLDAVLQPPGGPLGAPGPSTPAGGGIPPAAGGGPAPFT